MKAKTREDAEIAKKAQDAVEDALRRLLAVKQGAKIAKFTSYAAKAKRCAFLKEQVRNLLGSTKNVARQARLLRTLSRLEKLEHRLNTQKLAECHDHDHVVKLGVRKFSPFRRLSTQEIRVDFEALNEFFNEMEDSIEEELARATKEELDRALANAKNKIESGDIAGMAAIIFLFRARVKEIITRTVKQSYDFGKEAAAKEIGVDRPTTPLQDKQLMNVDAADIAEAYATNLENTLGAAIKSGIAAAASTQAIISAARSSIEDEAAKQIANISGTVVGQYVNAGRNTVIFDNVEKVVAMKRSEVLDDRTCALCISLDERVVDPSDPMAHLQTVHTYCRGQWVPILADDDEQPEVKGIPKTITDAFDKIDGRPIVNGFRQLKKPINKISVPAMEEIKKRLEAKSK